VLSAARRATLAFLRRRSQPGSGSLGVQRWIGVLAALCFSSLGGGSQPQAQDPIIWHERFPPIAVDAVSWWSLGDECADQSASMFCHRFDDPDAAVHVQPIYYGDLLTNTRGGISTRNATRYEGLLNLGVTVDFKQAECQIPGRLHLLGQTTHGQGLTEEIVGDSLVLSDIDSFRNITQLGELWWEFQAVDDSVTLRLGKQDVNTEFAYLDTAEHFVQSSFELTPNSALPTYPQQSFAAVALLQLHPSLQLKVGAWDALGDPGTWGFSGNGTVFFVSELEYKYTLRDGWLAGTISIGGGYLSEGEVAAQALDAVHGYALQWEQMLFRESNSDTSNLRGLAMFAAYYPRFFGSNLLLESIGNSAAGGLLYTGLLPQRDHDEVGVGVSWGELFQGGSNQEMVYEIFYRANLTSRISLQPDLQYISTPSGIHPDALVVGLRLQMEL
jgi:porin